MDSYNVHIIIEIIGIVVLVGIDRVTKHSYRLNTTKDSISLAPASETVKQ